MTDYHQQRFPNEDHNYRVARNALLSKEIELRKYIAEVAALRQQLPLGGKLKEDYIFDQGATDLNDHNFVKPLRFTELFEADKNSLVVYSFMYGPNANSPCPMCTSLLDSLNGNAASIQERVNMVVVAKASIQKIRAWARQRGWDKLRLLSSENNQFNLDYFSENADGEQWPNINVFRKTSDGIYHFYNSELFFVAPEEGQDPRHVDSIWPLWNVFDFTPDGRGTDWYPG